MGHHQVSSRPEVMTASMRLVPGGLNVLGSERHYPEERPTVEVEVGDLWWDPAPVTNAQFGAFVAETGHVSVAERAPDPADFPGADPALLVPGSQVFTQPAGPVPLDDWTRWWRWQPGAQWRHPEGAAATGSVMYAELPDHPVVHVGWEDALAYARWAGKDLPTEPEWEHAARGNLVGAEYAWGPELAPGGRSMANTWQGPFPWRSDDPLGHDRTSPVASYPPNEHGLFDMIGNVWEWTRTPWTPDHRDLLSTPPSSVPSRGDGRRGPTGQVGSGEPLQQVDVPPPSCCGGHRGTAPVVESDRMVTKGGSHLCSPYYCRRYRPAARQGHGVRDTASHVGFRCVLRVA